VSTINGKRVIVGGVVAGLVALVAEVLVEALSGAAMEAWLSGLGLEPPGEAVMLGYLVTAIVLGVVMVWLYAVARPRLGPGPGTALRIGLAVWALACAIPNVHLFGLGVMPANLFWITTLGTVVQMPLAALAGAWVYREEAAAPARGGASSHAAHV